MPLSSIGANDRRIPVSDAENDEGIQRSHVFSPNALHTNSRTATHHVSESIIRQIEGCYDASSWKFESIAPDVHCRWSPFHGARGRPRLHAARSFESERSLAKSNGKLEKGIDIRQRNDSRVFKYSGEVVENWGTIAHRDERKRRTFGTPSNTGSGWAPREKTTKIRSYPSWIFRD